jgi:hypothetical protein
MPAPIKVSLSKEKDQQLLNLQQHPETPPRVRYRAEIVRLNAYGWSVSQIADYKKYHLTRLEKAFAIGQIRDQKDYGKREQEAEKKVGKKKIFSTWKSPSNKSKESITADN